MTPETIERLWRVAEPELSASVSPPVKFARLLANEVREECAVAAWSTGMALYGKQFDAREVGSACANAIRELKQ